MYKEKDSEKAPNFWTVEGNTSHGVQLSGLGKYVLYEIQVLAFTRIGDGRSSAPSILERTLDDGKQMLLFLRKLCFSLNNLKKEKICHCAETVSIAININFHLEFSCFK